MVTDLLAAPPAAKVNPCAGDPRWGYSPISRRYVLRTGAVWKRLVRSGVVQDEEVAEQLAKPKSGARKRPPVNNVQIRADEEHLREVVGQETAKSFDPRNLTAGQLQEIARQLAGLNLAAPAGRARMPVVHRTASPTETEEEDLFAPSAADTDDYPSEPTPQPIRARRPPSTRRRHRT